MVSQALPILFYNLGGEMLYVLDQRLKAQKIPEERAAKVIADIVGTMFSHQFLIEMLKPQSLYTKQTLRTIFNKLVHSSIMKVNADSMERLYDLMIMAVKYQVTQCEMPGDILHITLNHLDAVLEFVAGNAVVHQKVSEIFHNLVEIYGLMTVGDFIMIRQSLLGFLQDTNNKVSIYLTEKVQNEDGRFIIRKTGEVAPGVDVPGTVRLFRANKETVINFPCGSSFKPSTPVNVSTEIGGKRSTTLGTNIYTNCHSADYSITSDSSSSGIFAESHRLAKAELGLLAQIIGSNEALTSNKEFRLQLFSSTNEPPPPTNVTSSNSKEPDKNVMNIKATVHGGAELSKIVGDLTISGNSSSSTSKTKGEDLLSLMDL